MSNVSQKHHTTSRQSTTPACFREQRQLHTFTNWEIAIRLSRMSQDGCWIEIDRAEEGSDSLVSHSMFADWSYSQQYRTTGVDVFANYGPRPVNQR